jgi:hypothetical protein
LRADPQQHATLLVATSGHVGREYFYCISLSALIYTFWWQGVAFLVVIEPR